MLPPRRDLRPMSCAARYSETTSLEFILNLFEFFFTQKSRLIEGSNLNPWSLAGYAVQSFSSHAIFKPHAHAQAPYFDARTASPQLIQPVPNFAVPLRRCSSLHHRTHGLASRAQSATHTCNAVFVTAHALPSRACIDDLFLVLQVVCTHVGELARIRT
ncbi:hypothetical protein EYW47_07100 [Paraburkholderia silviterrae]|uniref:Uncharacterized protein n=1 Tax=Paraburkholderia silviterrae TaxID=2528715 RepID=A0A4R5MEK5_9BURK|nr:hypothetical protein EYW47_07100 [Paraburkholderia silviterrae]